MKMKTFFAPMLIAMMLLVSGSLMGATLNVGPGETYTTIQAAIDDASADDVIEVAAETYDETVTIDVVGITLRGPNFGVSGNDVSRSSEATIGGQVIITADNITFDGFDVTPPDATTNSEGEAIRISNTPDNVVVKNNIVRDFGENGLSQWEGLDGIVAFGGNSTDAIQNVTITGNLVKNLDGRDTDGGAAGISIQGNVDGATVKNNVSQNIGMESTAWAFGIVVRGTGNHSVTPQNISISYNTVQQILSNPSTTTAGVGLELESGSASFSNNNVSNTEFLFEDKTLTKDLTTVIKNNNFDRGAYINNTGTVVFNSIQTAIDVAADDDVINVAAGTYELSSQMDIVKDGISIVGQGTVNIDANNSSWSTTNGEKHLIGIYAGTQTSPITISNVTMNCNDQNFGLNTYDLAYGILNDVTINDGKGAGLTVNGSTIIATDLNTSGNAWGAVNVDPGSGVTDPSVFTLNSGTLAEDWQIWSDGSNVTEDATVTVNAPAGYDDYLYDNGKKLWTNKELANVATITKNGETTMYFTIQGAIDAASDGDVIEVADGTYEEAITLNKPNITVKSINGKDKTTIDTPDGNLTTSVEVVANMGTIVFDGFTVTGFTESGIIQGMSARTGTTFKVHNNEVIPADDYLRNGIEVTGDGSEIIGNIVHGAPLTEDWAGTALMVVNASNVTVKSNEVVGNSDVGISVLNWDVSQVDDITLEGNNISGAGNGIRISGYNSSEPHSDVKNVHILDNTLNENEKGINAQTVVLENLTVTGNDISDNSDIGIRFSGTSATLSGSIEAKENKIVKNTNYGVYNGTTYPVDATGNYWGNPSTEPVGENVTYIPYLVVDEGGTSYWWDNDNNYSETGETSLSVDLVSFTATQKGGTVVLDWQTGAEINNMGFILERKAANSDWEEIAIFKDNDGLKGAGSTSEPQQYQFTDTDVKSGMTYEYRLTDVEYSGETKTHDPVSVKVKAVEMDLPEKFVLEQAYPNPFNPTTTIRYGVNEPGHVKITVYDMSGELVETLVNEQATVGYHNITWNASDVASGIYIYKINVDGKFSAVKRCVLMK